MAARRYRLAQRRKAVGYTQEQLAEQLGVDRATVIRWEAGTTAPQPFQWPNLATLLKLSADELTVLLTDASEAVVLTGEIIPRSPIHQPTHIYNAVSPLSFAPSPLPTAPDAAGELVESPAAVLERIEQQTDRHVTDALLDALDLYIADVIDRYETEGPATLAPDVVRQRRWLQPLLLSCPPSTRGARLMSLAGQLSAQLAYMAVNLGKFHSARAYGLEAFALADQVADHDLKAWVRGTQSFCAYYTGDYEHALELSLDGQRYAGSSPQAVRLIINGEARALGKLNRPVDKAVGKAYELLTTFPPEPGMSPCISFGLYSEARVASNAATAYLALQKTPEVLEHAKRAFAVVDTSPSIWSRALVRLDTASALAQGKRPDLEHATALGREAMDVSRHHRVESIKQRTRDLVTQLRPRTNVALVATFIDEANAWLSEDGPGR
jgi:transcriptional regulator with XRE-family HTH domain